MSAAYSTDGTSCRLASSTTNPMLTPSVKLRPWYEGSHACTEARSCSATAWPRASAHPGSTTANSSPPSRAAQPIWRTWDSSKRATWRSTSSPASCPAMSLTTVKWSRSRNSTTPSPAASLLSASGARGRIERALPRLLHLCLACSGDVLQNPDGAACHLVGPHTTALHAGPHGGAILAHEADIAIEGAMCGELGLHTLANAAVFSIVGIQGARRMALQFALGVAQHQAGLPAHHLQDAVARDDDAHRGTVEHGMELPVQRGLVLLLQAALLHHALEHLHQFAHFTPRTRPGDLVQM